MTVIVTVNVEARYRGFLTSVMLEIAPGVYTSPALTQGIRDRIWGVVARWYYQLGTGSIVMTWRDPSAPGGQQIRILGEPPKEIVEADGIHLVRYRSAEPASS
ncbi:MAG: type I-E CRISPR-associated endoribonuclease Cas2e [Chloroflexi bacterium]|nr:type I-E CRISPR-associated endoribonuclease Cas2e [Chloroflexota bacterium]